jgi:hypothetical protein
MHRDINFNHIFRKPFKPDIVLEISNEKESMKTRSTALMIGFWHWQLQ